MSKKTKNKILIFLFYFLSFLLFELIIGVGKFDENARQCIEDGDNALALFAPFVESGSYHFIFICCIVIYVKFSKKISIDNKHLIYWFPLCTFLFTLPMIIPTVIVARFLNIPFGN